MEFLSLTLLILSPLVMAGIIACPVFPNNETLIRRFSKSFSTIHLIYTLLFLMFFDQGANTLSYTNEIKVLGQSWLAPLGISFTFGVDGISILLIALTSFIFLIATIASKYHIKTNFRLYYSLLLVLFSTILGIFCARDMFVFFLLWEMELIPMYFLISNWGTGNAKKSATKFVIYTFLGSIFILFGILCLYFANSSTLTQLSGDFSQINLANDSYPIWFQHIIFIAFLIGFGVKLPIVPLHTWLPDAHSDAPTPISMILAGILLKLGVYGLIRFNIELLPAIFEFFAPLILVIGIINILYAGILAFGQKDLKRIIAYSSIQHMGLVLIGLGVLNEIGFNGAIFQTISHGIIVSGLFFIIGVVYLRTKTRFANELGGMGTLMPKFMFYSTILLLASIGVPLLMGFPGEFLIITGAFISDWNINLNILVTSVALIGLILTLGYMLFIFHRIFFAKQNNPIKKFEDIKTQEELILVMLSAIVLFFGVFPSKLLDFVNTSLYLISSIWQV